MGRGAIVTLRCSAGWSLYETPPISSQMMAKRTVSVAVVKAIPCGECDVDIAADLPLYFARWQVGGWVSLSYRISQADVPRDAVFRMQGYERDLALVRPYHTVLLRRTRADLLAALPSDASTELRRLVERSSVLLTLDELGMDISVTVAQVWRAFARVECAFRHRAPLIRSMRHRGFTNSHVSRI